jgi:hypothetical protein
VAAGRRAPNSRLTVAAGRRTPNSRLRDERGFSKAALRGLHLPKEEEDGLHLDASALALALTLAHRFSLKGGWIEAAAAAVRRRYQPFLL